MAGGAHSVRCLLTESDIGERNHRSGRRNADTGSVLAAPSVARQGEHRCRRRLARKRWQVSLSHAESHSLSKLHNLRPLRVPLIATRGRVIQKVSLFDLLLLLCTVGDCQR